MNEVYFNRLTGSILESLREKVKAFNFTQFLKSKTDNFVDVEKSELETTLYTTNNLDSYDEFEEELPDDGDISEDELPINDSVNEEELPDDSDTLDTEVSSNSILIEDTLNKNNEIKEDDYMSKAINKRKRDKKITRINRAKDTGKIEKEVGTTIKDTDEVEKELDTIVDKFNEEQIVITRPNNSKEVSVEEVPNNSKEVSVEEVPNNSKEVSIEEVPNNSKEVSIEEVPNNSKEVSVEEVPNNSKEVSILYLKECYDKCISIMDIRNLNDKILKVYKDGFIITDNNVINIISTAYNTLDNITHSNNLQKVLMYLKQHYGLLDAMKKVSTESVDANKIMENFIKVLSKNTTQS